MAAGAARGLKGFCGARAPSVNIGKYVERIHRYAACIPACFVVWFVYIDRAVHRQPGSLVVSLNVHRLIVTSVLIASKVLDDTHHNNAFYARVGGLSNVQLNRLELDLLFLLDFDVTVSLPAFREGDDVGQSWPEDREREPFWTPRMGSLNDRLRLSPLIDVLPYMYKFLGRFFSHESVNVFAGHNKMKAHNYTAESVDKYSLLSQSCLKREGASLF